MPVGQYVTAPPDEHTDVGPLLRHVIKVKGGHRLKAVTAQLAQPIKATGASRLREGLQEMCSQVAIHKSIELHSCRIEGATEAAKHRHDPLPLELCGGSLLLPLLLLRWILLGPLGPRGPWPEAFWLSRCATLCGGVKSCGGTYSP